jgi:hypothetical protein
MSERQFERHVSRRLGGGPRRTIAPLRPSYRRPRERRAHRTARTTGSRGDPPEPDLARRVCLSSPGRARGEA